jgi:hypothetical protein
MAQTSTGSLSVKQAFDVLLQRIELNPTRSKLASQRYQALKETVEANAPGKTVKQIGSFQRQTKIRPEDLSDGLDVDALVIFGSFTKFAGPGENGVTPNGALQQVDRSLTASDTYSVMEPEQDSPAVVLEYNDAFKVEFVPAFIDKRPQFSHGDLDINCYIVPDGKGGWKTADYDYDAALISAVNGRTDVAGMLVPFIKMAKAYLRGKKVPLKSFHIEILATLTIPKAIGRWSQENLTWGYQHLLAEFLSTAPDLMTRTTVLTQGLPVGVSLPGSFSPATDSGLGTDENKAVVAYLKKQAGIAWKLCGIKDEVEAVAAWREFFGDPFPAV